MLDGTWQGLWQAARFTVIDPRAAARALMAMGVPVGARWMGLALAAVGSTLLTVLTLRLSPMGTDPAVQEVLSRPLMLAAMQGVVLVVVVQLMARVGRLAGGTGRFADALLLMAWLQLILMGLQLAQLVLELAMPLLAELLGLVGLGLLFWLLTNFVAELHGFRSLGMVFAGIVGTALAASFAVALVMMSVMGA